MTMGAVSYHHRDWTALELAFLMPISTGFAMKMKSKVVRISMQTTTTQAPLRTPYPVSFTDVFTIRP